MFRQEVGTEAMAGEAAGPDQLDLDAAEQLIQLSGGDGDGGSESRSADSVNKCCGADRAGGEEEKDKEAAVESRLRRKGGRFLAGKGGDGGALAGEPGRKSAGGVSDKRPRAAGTEEEAPGVESLRRRSVERFEAAVESRRRRRSAGRFPAGKGAAAGVLDDGDERKRPRFRWLADLYRETRQLRAPGRRTVGGDDDPPEGERSRKRAGHDADEVVVIPKK